MSPHPTDAPPQDRRIRASDGVELAWRQYGPAGGRPLLVCHGLAASGRQFEADAHFFAARGFSVLVPDLRGHGESEKPDPGREGAYSIERMARDLLEVMDAAGVARVDYLGNSLGGILALSLLASHPERFATLAMFGTSPALGLPGLAEAVIPLSYRFLGARRSARIAAHTASFSPEGRRLIEEIVSRFDPEVGRAISASVRRYDFSENLSRFAGPVLIVRCGRDIAVNQAMRELLVPLSERASVEIVDLPGAGHCANLDEPEALHAVLLDFWARHAPTAGEDEAAEQRQDQKG